MSSTVKDERRYLLCAVVGTAAVATFCALQLSGDQRFYFFYYNVPIAAPFSAFVLERLLRLRGNGLLVTAFDVGVVVVALARGLMPIPGYSGHVLFLLYALFSSRSKTVRVLSALVLCQVLVVKFALWDDFVTPLGAAGIATLALLIRAKAAHSKTPSEAPVEPSRT